VSAVIVVLVAVLFVGFLLASSSVRILREYERGVVFRLGRLVDQKGPGLIFLVPGIDRMVRTSLRTITLNIPPQEIITRDNVTARVNAVTYFKVVDPNRSVVEVEDVVSATSQIAQTTLRSVLGKAELDTLLSERERLNEDLQQIIDEQTEPWGIKVSTVEIKDVEIPDSIQLRYLQTLIEVGVNQNSTIVFPLPIDLIGPLLDAVKPGGSSDADRSTPAPEVPKLAPAPEPTPAPAPAPAQPSQPGLPPSRS